MSLIITKLALLACGAVGARCLPGLIRRRRPAVEPAAEPEAQGDPGASAGPEEPVDAMHDRRIATAGAAFGLAAVGSVAAPPLVLAALPLLGASTAAFAGDALGRLRRGRRVAVSLVDLGSAVVVVASNQIALLSLGQLAYHVSRRLLAHTEDQTRDAFCAAISEGAPTALRVGPDGVERVPLDALAEGDRVRVSAGAVIPIDGRVVEGSALVDQRMLTGETQPAHRVEGDPVLASTLVLEGRIEIAVERAGADSVAGRVRVLLESTEDFKSRVVARGERVVEQGARPTLLLGALAWPLLGPSGALALSYASFGYHMRTAAPLCVLGHLGAASSRGVLIKDGRALETLGRVDTVIFDKTGTLTEDRLEIERVEAAGGWSADDVLRFGAMAEQGQSHPIARALLDRAAALGVALPPVDHAACALGFGLRIAADGRRVVVGSARMMARERLPIPDALTAPGAGSQVFVAVDGQVIGQIVLRPVVRPEAARLVARLKGRGVEVRIVSGDHEGPTRALADALGIARYHAGALPDEKARIVEELRAAGRTVCFVGDGINDAVALKAADVPVSLSGASGVALDTASVVLLDGTLACFEHLLALADELRCDLDRGVLLSVAPGLVVVAGVFTGAMGIAGALVMYNASMVMTVGYAMRPWLRRRCARPHPRLEPS